MSESIITSLADPVTFFETTQYVGLKILNFRIGFQKATAVFAVLPGGLKGILTEPAIYCLVRPWFKVGGVWAKFNGSWDMGTAYFHAGNSLWWDHEFDIRDPPSGPDCRIKNYVDILPNHRQFKFITKVTPYVDLENIGIEYAWAVKSEYINAIQTVYVEKADGTIEYLPLQQVKDIKTDIPNSIMRIGLVYDTPALSDELLFIFDETDRNWDHNEIETRQLTIQGTPFWVCRIGGANLATPQPVAAYEEVVF